MATYNKEPECKEPRVIGTPVNGYGIEFNLNQSKFKLFFPMSRLFLPIIYEVHNNDEFEPKIGVSILLGAFFVYLANYLGMEMLSQVWTMVIIADLVMSIILFCIECAPLECKTNIASLELVSTLKYLTVVSSSLLLVLFDHLKTQGPDIYHIFILIAVLVSIISGLSSIYFSKAKLTLKKFICWYLYV
jgi:hypothetical protein